MNLLEAVGRRHRLDPERAREALADRDGEGIDGQGRALIEAGVAPEPAVLGAWAELCGMACWDRVPPESLAADLVREVSVEWARSRCLLPVRDEGRIKVLSAEPFPGDALNDLASLLGEDPELVLARREHILAAIEACYAARGEASMEASPAEPAAPAPAARSEDLLSEGDHGPAARYLNALLLSAIRQGASDVHFEPYEDRVRVRFRIDGVLHEQAPPPKALDRALVSRVKVMAQLDIAEKRLPQDGMAKVRSGAQEIDLRVSIMPVAEGERLVLRLLHRASARIPMGDLGMGDLLQARLRDLLGLPHGMVLVTGPTGSGKTTTLYAALQELDTRRQNILTIEDPIEYQLPQIGQIQVRPRIGLTFAQGLRHILRQDPDVIFVGETRDQETAQIAVRASLTGHLVLTTLHTNDAPGAVLRLVDMGIEPFLLASAFRAALGQRLVRCLCPACRRPDALDEEWTTRLATAEARIPEGATWMRPEGCPECLEGFRGRNGLFELLVADDAIEDAIRGGAGRTELRRLAAEQGMVTILQDGVNKAAQGRVDLTEVWRVAGRAG